MGPAAVLQLQGVINIWVDRLNDKFEIDCCSEDHDFILTYLTHFLSKLSK